MVYAVLCEEEQANDAFERVRVSDVIDRKPNYSTPPIPPRIDFSKVTGSKNVGSGRKLPSITFDTEFLHSSVPSNYDSPPIPELTRTKTESKTFIRGDRTPVLPQSYLDALDRDNPKHPEHVPEDVSHIKQSFNARKYPKVNPFEPGIRNLIKPLAYAAGILALGLWGSYYINTTSLDRLHFSSNPNSLESTVGFTRSFP